MHTKSSSRLINLRIQAERGIPAEYELAYAGSLTDQGYELDGSHLRIPLEQVEIGVDAE